MSCDGDPSRPAPTTARSAGERCIGPERRGLRLDGESGCRSRWAAPERPRRRHAPRRGRRGHSERATGGPAARPAEVRALAGSWAAPDQAARAELRPRRQHRAAHRARRRCDARRRGPGGRPGLGSLTLGLLRGGAPRSPRSRSTRCWPDGCPRPWPIARRSCADRLTVVDRRRAAGARRLPGPAPTALVANLPYNVGVPVVLHLLAELPVAAARAGDGAGGGGRAAGRRARVEVYGVPSRQAGLVRRGAAGRAGAARGVLAGARTSTPGLVALDPPRPAAAATAPQVFAVVDAAFAQRRKMLRSALAGGPGRRRAAEAALRGGGDRPDGARRATGDHRLRPHRSAPRHALR